jgi:hypothetical protein
MGQKQSRIDEATVRVHSNAIDLSNRPRRPIPISSRLGEGLLFRRTMNGEEMMVET